jgi:hypothetical protein
MSVSVESVFAIDRRFKQVFSVVALHLLVRPSMPRGRPKGSKSKGKVGRPRKTSEHSARVARKSSEPSPTGHRKPVLVKQGKLTASQVGPLIAKVSAVCDSVLSSEKSNGGSKFKSAIRVFTNELRRQMLSIGDEYMGSTASERKFLQLSRDRAALQKSLLNASKHVNDTRWDLRRTNQQQKAMVDNQADLQELQCILRDLAGMKVRTLLYQPRDSQSLLLSYMLQDSQSRCDTPVQDAEADHEQLRFLHHINVFSHLSAVASLSRSHHRLKSANDQIAALLAVIPPVSRMYHSDLSHSSLEGTEV